MREIILTESQSKQLAEMLCGSSKEDDEVIEKYLKDNE
jgi:hypothetical protein